MAFRAWITAAGSATIACTALVGGLASAPVSAAVSTTADAYNAAVLADKPRLYWSLDEASGPVRDLTGTAGASTMAGGTLGVDGAAGKAVAFDGNGQRVQVPYSASMRLPASFTAEVWAKLPSEPQTTGWPTIFNRGRVDAKHYGTAMWVSSDAKHQVAFKRNGTDVLTSRGLDSARFHHLAFTYDSAAKRWTWYFDGTRDTTGVLSGLAGTDTETGPLLIGAMQALNGSAVNPGKLSVDGLAFYGSALTAGQVANHYAAATSGSTAPAPTTTTPAPKPTTTTPAPKPTTTTPAPTTPAAPAANGRYVGGVAVGANQPWNTRRAADYAAMGAANSTWIRSDLGWAYLEPIKGDWRWNYFDQVIADTKANNMRYLAVLHTVPSWANGNVGDYGMPSDLSLMTNYCYQTAKHYIPMGVTEYEIGNEINLPHPGWATSGATYAKSYLTPCVTGLRKAQAELGAKITIVFGSVAPTEWTGGTDPATFIKDAYANGAKGKFDAMGWHPYSGGDLARSSRNVNDVSAQLYNLMVAQGDGDKKIWATEYGMPTGGDASVSEQTQVDYLNSVFDTWYAKPFAGPLFWYSARDSGTSSTDREQHFGVLRADGSAKLAYAALKSRMTR
ncbi:cellulase family glycosylhydrolase [Actinoplanes sp. GCM10030250]|uniref:cellulase family glycosylhydrolase n=1 Tax=Actinoplanes sp. GCM10030250 TaxID=3273376 RepID=UPI00361BA045